VQHPKWFVIARNEYRVNINNIRAIRRPFPYITVAFLVVYVLYLAPMFVNLFIDDVLTFIISKAAIPMVQLMLFSIFFTMTVFPITNTLRELGTKQLEIFLAAPVKPSDVLLGEFLGKMPFYIIALVVVTGTFTALLGSLGLNFVQNAMIIAAFIMVFLTAFWIGTVISAILRTRIGKSTRAKDFGKGISAVIMLPVVAIIYAMIGGGLTEALIDPSTSGAVRAALDFLPSSWAAEIFVAFASNSANASAIFLENLVRFGGLSFLFVAVLWLGTKLANRAYSLESTTFTAPIAKPDGLFYKTLRGLRGGGSSGTLLATVFKDYSRRFENLSFIIYAVSLVVLIVVFLEGPNEGAGLNIVRQLNIMPIPMISGFVVGTISRGKRTLFLYKRAPNGIIRFVKARLLQSWLMAVPIIAIIATVMTIIFTGATLVPLLSNVLLASFRTIAMVVFLFSLALLIPFFGEESRERTGGIMVYLMTAIFTSIGFELGFSSTGWTFEKTFPNIDPYIGMLSDRLLETSIFLLIGILLLYLGIKKLNKIE